jgi:hypothetical protein
MLPRVNLSLDVTHDRCVYSAGNGTTLSTIYQSPALLNATVPANLIGAPGVANVTVSNSSLTSKVDEEGIGHGNR